MNYGDFYRSSEPEPFYKKRGCPRRMRDLRAADIIQ